MASTLINNSYSDWQESPISTTITTHPIAELDFPTVTVCPPRGSHTALNYDLIQSQSMTGKDREYLLQAVYDNFIKFQHKDYAMRMLAATNTENLENIRKGIQSLPRPFDVGFEVNIKSSFGTVHSPLYGEKYDGSYFKSDRSHQVVLEFPDDLSEQVGKGKLVVELEVDSKSHACIAHFFLEVCTMVHQHHY